MSCISNYSVGLLNFIFTNYDIHKSIFDVFNFKEHLTIVEPKDEDDYRHIFFSSSIKEARRRYRLKNSTKIEDLQQAYYRSIRNNYYIYEHFNGDVDKIEESLKKEFSFRNYMKAVSDGIKICYRLKEIIDYTDLSRHYNEITNAFAKYKNKSKLYELLGENFKDLLEGDGPDSFLLIDEYSPDYYLKLIIEAADDDFVISYDISELCDSGMTLKEIEEKDESPRVLVITEGTTDAYYIKPMIGYLYPSYDDCFSFLPLENLDSGTSYLAKYYKMLNEANLKRNILFIFDNDVEGNNTFNSLPKKKDPYIFKIVLPNHRSFRSYPCISFDGAIVNGDINGTAVSTELLFPEMCLMVGGRLSPIRWENYSKKTMKYQGVISDKTDVQKNIKIFIKTKPLPPTNCEFEKLRLLIESMINCF